MLRHNNSKTIRMNISILPMFKRCAINGFAAIALLLAVSTEGNAKSMDDVINLTTSFLIKDWVNDENYNEWLPPQVMAVIPGSTRIYGACGEWLKGDHVAGSYYCPATHTIILEAEETVLHSLRGFGQSLVILRV